MKCLFHLFIDVLVVTRDINRVNLQQIPLFVWCESLKDTSVVICVIVR